MRGERRGAWPSCEASGNWDEVALASQQIVLGRVDGVEIDLRGAGDGELADASSRPTPTRSRQARFVLMSPAPPRRPTSGRPTPDVHEQLEQLRSGGWERSAREAETIPLIDTGRALLGPGGARAAGA